jgi:hypothetical protein
MTNLENKNISFMLISSSKLNDITSILYTKEYNISYIKSFYKEKYEDCIIAYSDVDNDILRSDVLFILDHFDESSIIIKYKNEEIVKKIFKNGSEKLLETIMYDNNNDDDILYIINGISFSFTEVARYWIPTKKEDFKEGMTIEYFNNDKWNQIIVDNVDEEYENLYKLLIKYNKIRAISKF